MEHPEKLASLGTADTGCRQTTLNTKQNTKIATRPHTKRISYLTLTHSIQKYHISLEIQVLSWDRHTNMDLLLTLFVFSLRIVVSNAYCVAYSLFRSSSSCVAYVASLKRLIYRWTVVSMSSQNNNTRLGVSV
jgi:hypothetical protein